MVKQRTKILILGASGMLGHATMRLMSESDHLEVWGSVRSAAARDLLPRELHDHVICGVDVESTDDLNQLFGRVRPNVVINCIGLVKQLAVSQDPIAAITVNALLPHRLARLCATSGSRLIHVSTDCVFAGTKGMYREEDFADAYDLYGRSKYLGEVDYPHAVTLRTSIIGHELQSAKGLIGWFLSQTNAISGFTRAVFSGLPTVELAGVMRDYVLPDEELCGLYHVASKPISKYELLGLVAREYGKTIDIHPDNSLIIDRSLDATRFFRRSGYVAPEWSHLVHRMREFG